VSGPLKTQVLIFFYYTKINCRSQGKYSLGYLALIVALFRHPKSTKKLFFVIIAKYKLGLITMPQKQIIIVLTVFILVLVVGLGVYQKAYSPEAENVIPSLASSTYPYNLENYQNQTNNNMTSTSSTPAPSSESGKQVNGSHLITLKTEAGDIQFETYDADAPKTVQNFITLAGKGFYEGVIFHRVIKGFMIQGGDPTGTGMGGPGYKFEDELNPATPSYQAGYQKGVVAMANSGPNTNGSQFFIMLENVPLQKDYTIFGKVVKGQEVVDKIGAAATGANDRPVAPVKILKATVETK